MRLPLGEKPQEMSCRALPFMGRLHEAANRIGYGIGSDNFVDGTLPIEPIRAIEAAGFPQGTFATP
jgi:hypothetical protein